MMKITMNKLSKVNSQKGYATIFAVLLMGVIMLALYSLYDVGQVTTQRQKMQNTADATAYSAVSVVTRDMNFIAYTNRAMVTNQVAIGQLAAMSSWVHMADITVDNYDKVASYIQKIPYIGTIIGGILRAMTTIMKYITDITLPIIDNTAKIGIPVQDKINGLLSSLQTIYHGIAVKKSYEIYTDVAKQNDPDISQGLAFNGVGMASVIKSFQSKFESYDPKHTRGWGSRSRKVNKRFNQFAGMVKDSRDQFQPRRTYRYWDFDLWFVRFHFDRAGGTDFYMKKDRNGYSRWQWTSLDTHSFWFGTWDWWNGWDDSEIIPLGWGAAHALQRNVNNGNKRFYYGSERWRDGRQNQWYNDGHYNRNPRRERAWGNSFRNPKSAWSVYRPAWFSGNNRRDIENNLAKTDGLRKFRDFKHDDKIDVGPDLVVLLTKDASNIRTMETIDNTNSDYNRPAKLKIEEQGSMANNKLYTLAKAESYFSRPAEEGKTSKGWSLKWRRGDRLREYGNLYNPFWQTRLVDTSEKEKALALVTLGL